MPHSSDCSIWWRRFRSRKKAHWRASGLPRCGRAEPYLLLVEAEHPDDGHITLGWAVHHDRRAGITREGRPHDDTVLRGAAAGSELPDTDRDEKSGGERAAQRPLWPPRATGDRHGAGGLGSLDPAHDPRPKPRPVGIGDRGTLLKE